MEDLVTANQFYAQKRVLVTGHTGFKGSWLCEWLLLLGAEVHGISLPSKAPDDLFNQLDLEGRITGHRIIDVRDPEDLQRAITEIQPQVVFHLAAQALVNTAYEIPVETFSTNVMGTVHLLQALRQVEQNCAAVFVTTDKVYENREWDWGYRENDPLGGYDPYSSSKAASEIAISSFRQSFFNPSMEELRVGVASARAGNVIGGGDYSEKRIVPDCFRAIESGDVLGIRSPKSIRPWQYVLEPLYGYMVLASRIYNALQERDSAGLEALCSAFNFGPNPSSCRPVDELVGGIAEELDLSWETTEQPGNHEAKYLRLQIDKAYRVLKWSPVFDFEETIKRTTESYRKISRDGALSACQSEISHYIKSIG
jgi:CDP-glucose 4,6-dehydratase